MEATTQEKLQQRSAAAIKRHQIFNFPCQEREQKIRTPLEREPLLTELIIGNFNSSHGNSLIDIEMPNWDKEFTRNE